MVIEDSHLSYKPDHDFEGCIGPRLMSLLISIICGGISAFLYVGCGWSDLPAVITPLILAVIAFISFVAALGEDATSIFETFH